jgi:2-dehydro-3-deoxyphosphogluconate aldolase/(4S)-4-hydroxy-2-oxoglutarate aldolase
MSINNLLAESPVVPLVQADDPAVAVSTSRALAAGGLNECLRAVADEVPETIAGAGTVLSASQAMAALEHGAKFIVSPGLDEGVPVYPGTMTPGEVQRAFNLGLDVVKFFPASIAGGVPALKALGSVFRTMKFMPTGGISAGNLADFLAVPSVLACGGSWLTPGDAIAAGDFDKVTALAAAAVEIARQARAKV